MKYTCPVCGRLVFGEPPGSFEICPICFWEDDAVQLAFPDMSGGANHVSLIEAQKNYAEHGVCELRLADPVRLPNSGDTHDTAWRRLDPAVDMFLRWGSEEDRAAWNLYKNNAELGLYYWCDGYFLGSRSNPWCCLGTTPEGQRFQIGEIDVWKHQWERLGQRVRVKDPLYRQTFFFDVYRVKAGSQVIEFAAGEFSSNVWGFYVRKTPCVDMGPVRG